MAERLPDLLTVEEAARVARVGRTKAYAMAREWRATGGRSGLPVVDFGHVLRVPRRALEELIGAELTTGLREDPDEATRVGEGNGAEPAEAPAAQAAEPRALTSESPAASTRRNQRRHPTPNQLDLFDPPH